MNSSRIFTAILILTLCFTLLNTDCDAKSRAKEVAKGIYAITDLGFSNVGFIVTDEGVVVIDTSLAPFMAQEFIKEIKAVTDKPVKYVVNTHWHTDHIGGNESFVPQAHIISHEFTRKIIAQRKKEQKEGKIDEQLKSYGITFTPPDITFDKDIKLHMGDKIIEILFFGGGHTGGDIHVYLPKEKVIFTGDIFAKGSGIPDYRDDGSIDRQIESLRKILSLDVDKIVLGHLHIGEKKDVQESLDKLLSFRAEVKKYVDGNTPVEKATEEIKFPKGGNPFYKANFKKVITKVYNDLKKLKE